MTSPRTILKANLIKPRKALGQNFLSDQNVAKSIVAHAGIRPDDTVLEIGAGLGALTILAAQGAARVIAVEKDHQIVQLLKNEILLNGLDNVTVLDQDILKLDIAALKETDRHGILVLGNLPYNISSQVVVQLIHARATVRRAILMFQKELAARLTASPGSKTFGRLSVMLQYCAKPQRLLEVQANQFYPRPKVDSEVLSIQFKSQPDQQARDEGFLFAVIKAAFQHRRKTIRNSLASSQLRFDSATLEQVLNETKIDPGRRAETLTVKEFVALSNRLYQEKS